jgi:2-amino-4-hydroxy-6-hydroxymethyldihydropteridine diphosphokinase
MGSVRAYIGLGANVGDARWTLTAAVHALGALPGTSLAGVSRLYVTTPVEVTDQPDFHNAVVGLDVPAGPDPETGAVALLVALKSIERAFGRKERFRYGPRELDLDLLLFGHTQIAVERPPEGRSLDPAQATRLLEVPHPQARRRLFVLAPLSELAPDLVPPGWDESVARARARQEAMAGSAAVRPVARWDPDPGEWVGGETGAPPRPS